ncbi:MAG: InlB B-repeat-containing protein [Clostridia bacterium]|nr:InlB B-repeat-containing protein [Clostridia bacterium]
MYKPTTHEHTWDDGVVTRPATATEDGQKTFTCVECGAKTTATIPRLSDGKQSEIQTGTLVTFGSYPQTRVTDSSLLSSLNSRSLTWKYYDYYADGKQENYMKYADITYSGDRYRAVAFSHYRPQYTYDSENYTYQDDNGYEPDTVYWFKYEPIVWRILDVAAGLMMTEKIIDSQPFHTVYYDQDYMSYGDAGHNHYASNWAYSYMRTWLNGDFYNTAFGTEKSYIKNTALNTPSSYSSSYDADPTTDRVFLLSGTDVINASYGFGESAEADENNNRVAFGTDYAKCQGLWVNSSSGYYFSGASFWLLRTPSYSSNSEYLDAGGGIRDDIIGVTYIGTRPALSVNLQSAVSQSLIRIFGSSVPSGSVSATNNVASSQTVTLSMSDDIGVSGYYWGKSSTYTDNSWTATGAAKATKTVSSPGTYYFTVKSENGNVSPNYSITFCRTTFDANGGSVSPASVLTEKGNTFTFPTPMRSGYTFGGWYTAASGGTKVSSGSAISGNTTVYAHWTAVSKNTYTVKYDANGGSGAPSAQTKTEGKTLTLSSSKPSKSYTITYNANNGSVSPASKTVSCTFGSWNTKKDGSGTTCNPGGSYTKNADVTLYAQWKNPIAGTLATPTRSGYTFGGWYTAASGGTKITSSSTISANTTVYAHWTQKNTYTVSYDPNGGTGTPSVQKKSEGVSLKLSSFEPSKTYTISYNSNGGSVSPASKTVDCAFNNWNTKKDGSGTTYKPGDSYNKDADVTLYAQWKNPSAGTLATPKRPGYSFMGWYTDSSGGTRITSSSDITRNIKLYAHWMITNIYNIGEETYSFKNISCSVHKGHCFGMSMTSSGYYLGLIDFSAIGGNSKSKLYSFSFTNKVHGVLDHYQSKQGSYSSKAMVAGGTNYKDEMKKNIETDWREVIAYVKSHKYDNSGELQIGFRGQYHDEGVIKWGGHAVNFLRYDKVNGQDRIYAYDNNFPETETYFYMDSKGLHQAPIATFDVSIFSICLRDIKTYFSNVNDKGHDSSRDLYSDMDEVVIKGISGYVMDGESRVMYEIPEDQQRVYIYPLVDNAEIICNDTEHSFGHIEKGTYGVLEYKSHSKDDNFSGETGSEVSFTIYKSTDESVDLPVIISQPGKNISAAAGTEIELSVIVTGATSYQWQVSKDNGNTWKNSDVPSAGTDTLKVDVTEETTGLLYRCAVANDKGTVYTDEVRIEPEAGDHKGESTVRGDADGDFEVLANDARMVLRASAKLEKLSDAAFERCDLDGDGNLLAEEARMILRYSAKLEKTI